MSALEGMPFTKFRLSAGCEAESDLLALEEVVATLAARGVQAELTLSRSGAERACEAVERLRCAERLVSRFAAYPNVWWSLEPGPHDFDNSAWLDSMIRLIEERDPYRHLLTLFGDDPSADYSHPAITHVSLRCFEPHRIPEFARMHRKPILLDDCGAEGDAPRLEASLPGEEMTNRIWIAMCRKGYAAHGEAYSERPHGPEGAGEAGTIRCESAERIAFLRGLLEEAPSGLRYMPEYYDAPTIGRDGEWYLQYYGIHRFPYKQFDLPPGTYRIDMIDVWNMKLEATLSSAGGEVTVPLRSLPYYAVRIRREGQGPGGAADLAVGAEELNRRMEEAEAADNFVAKEAAR
jgi:hypothetical protein